MKWDEFCNMKMIKPLSLLGHHDKVSLSGNYAKFKFCFPVCV